MRYTHFLSGFFRGQALVTLLIFTAVASIIILGAVSVIASHLLASSTMVQSTDAYSAALSGMDHAKLSLLRDIDYLGETLTVGDGTVTISISNTWPKTILSTGKSGEFVRSVSSVVTKNNTILSFGSVIEVP